MSLTALLFAAAPAHAQGGGSGGGPPSGVPTPPPPPTPELVVDRPTKRTLIYEGQAGRLLLGGRWYFRQDDAFVGDRQRFFSPQAPLSGWSAVPTPHSWNATDTTLNLATVGWYRKEFRLPRTPKGTRWAVRFEGSNYRTKLWLNGRHIGGFTGLFPFEADLDGLKKGRNTLVAKVSTLRSRTDLTHWRPAPRNGYGTGGWWNSGGLLREVYVRPMHTVDLEDVRVLPRVRRVGGPATVEVRASVRNLTRKAQRVGLAIESAGRRIVLNPREVEPGVRREIVTRFEIPRPALWQPGRPRLYGMKVHAAADGARRATYRLRYGIKKLEVRKGGIVMLNGRRLNLRGASIHEDDKDVGAALTPGVRRLLVGRLKDLGASVTRSHYPLHPQFLEAFDRQGILYWVDAPVYQLPNRFLDTVGVRTAATRAVRLTVMGNANNASVMTYSLINEPASSRGERGLLGAGASQYFKTASKQARELDPTKLIAIERQARVGEPLTFPAWRHLDVLGVNEYFGWYPSFRAGLTRPPTATQELGPYLDSLHRANPNLGLFITEFGAEGARNGPETQKGSLEFQRKWALEHLAIHRSKRWINGSIYWALRDFRVDPTWRGGAPAAWTTPPWHNKSLIDETNARKPVYEAVKRQFRRTKPLR